jgi:low temperature requirement protein LtrA
MRWPGFKTDLLREDGEHAERVSFLELFFDLVFVFAVTQISHTFVKSIDEGHALEGGLQAALVILAVWWVWVYTAWVTNWLDPDKPAVRWMLIVLMVLGLLMSTSIPEAFGDRAVLFVSAYVVMQIGRAVFTILSMVRFAPENALNVTRITIWFSVSAVFWFWGAFSDDLTARLLLWGVAIVIEYLGPVSRYWVPGLRSSYIGGIPIRGGHMSERAGLFVIIAIGESVLVTGTAFTDHPIDIPNTLAFFASVLGSILLWLLYFSRAEAGGSRFIRRHSNPSLVAANSYTYLHVVLVAGIVMVAVADELVLAHPLDGPGRLTLAFIYGAPALYLVGNLVFKKSIGAPWLRSHLGGVALLLLILAATLLPGWPLPALGHSWIANAVLASVVIGEEFDFQREVRRRRSLR